MAHTVRRHFNISWFFSTASGQSYTVIWEETQYAAIPFYETWALIPEMPCIWQSSHKWHCLPAYWLRSGSGQIACYNISSIQAGWADLSFRKQILSQCIYLTWRRIVATASSQANLFQIKQWLNTCMIFILHCIQTQLDAVILCRTTTHTIQESIKESIRNPINECRFSRSITIFVDDTQTGDLLTIKTLVHTGQQLHRGPLIWNNINGWYKEQQDGLVIVWTL